MKKINNVLLLAIVISLALSACTASDISEQHTPSSTELPTQAFTLTSTVEMDNNIDSVTLSEINEQDTSNPSYFVKTSLPKVEVPENPELEQKINDDIAKIKESFLESLYSFKVPDDAVYGVEINYDSDINEKGLLNLNIYAIFNTGTAHPYMQYKSLNYNLNSGTLIALDDLFVEGSDYTSIIIEKINEIITAQEDEIKGSYFVDTNDILDYGIVSLGQTELLLKYVPGEIAPYAVGEIVFNIPYIAFKQILTDEFNTILLK